MEEFFELRTYKIYPGKMSEWIEFMEETIIPFQVSKGMVINGSFTVEEDNETYVWIRRFNNKFFSCIVILTSCRQPVIPKII